MPRHPNKAAPVPAQTPEITTISVPVEATAPVVEKVEYYRIKKISGSLAQLLCVEVDETTNPPKIIGKADLPVLVQDRALPYLFPSIDQIERRAKEKARAAGGKK